jgi:O-antigen/teichoic acid export membrane protein
MADALAGASRRSALALGGASVSGLATILTVIIATRSLSDSGAGEYFVAIALFAIAQALSSLGAETGLQYFVPTMPTDSARRLIARIEIASGVIGTALAVLVFAGASGVATLLAGGDGATQATTDVIRMAALTLPFAGLYEVSMGALRACDEVVASSILDRVIRPIAQVAAMIGAAVAGWGPTGMYLAWVLPTLVTVIVAVIRLGLAELPSTGEHAMDVPRSVFWRYTGPRSVARVAQALTQRLDVLILAAVFSLQDAAVYAAASRCMIAGVFLATALKQTVQPQLRREIAFGDRATVKAVYGATTTWLVLATWPVYLAMITHASVVMGIFGPEYVTGAPVLSLLSGAMLVAIACGLVDVVLLMLGRSWLSLFNVLAALVVNVVLNLALAPHLGMIGSAIAWVAAILIGNVVPLLQTSRVGLHPGGRPLWTACAISVVAFGIPLMIERLFFGDELRPFLVALAASTVLYGALVHSFRRSLVLDHMRDSLRPRRSVRRRVIAE